MKSRNFSLFLRYYLPIACVIVIGGLFYAHTFRIAERTRLEESERYTAQLAADMLARRLAIVVRDAHALANDGALARILKLDAAAGELRRVEEDFLGFSRARPAYDRVSLVDLAGNELVGVDLDNAQPLLINRNRLENQAGRADFVEGLRLSPGEIYLSPISLRAGPGELDVPYRPILHVVTPVADDNGQKRALLFLDYRFSEMLRYVDEVTAPVAGRLMIVNHDGYFLRAPNHQDEWGGTPGRTALGLAQRYPGSWRSLASTDRGQFEDGQGLWTVATSHQPLAGQGKPGRPEDSAAEWKVVLLMPAQDLPGWTSMLGPWDIASIGFLLGFSALLTALFVRNTTQREMVERRFRLYFENAIVGMAISDEKKRWIVVNPALCAIFGYSAAQLAGKSWLELTHPDDRPAGMEAYKAILRGESEGFQKEERYIRADGEVIHARTNIVAMRKPDRSVDVMLIMLEDISGQHEVMAALRASEERLRSLGDNLPNAYVYQCARRPGENVAFTYLSSGVRQVHGVEPEAILGDPDLLFRQVDPAHVPDIFSAMEASERDLSDFAVDIRIQPPGSGMWRWLQLRSRPQRLASGEVLWNGVAVDITARRDATALLDLQARRAEVLLELPRLSAELDELAFMQRAIADMERLTGSQTGFIVIINDDGESVELVAWSPNALQESRHAWLEQHYRITQTDLWAEAARLKRPITINGSGQAGSLPGLLDAQGEFTRLISVPVIDGEDVRLMACLGNKATDYTETDAETLQLLANATWRIVDQRRAERALMIASQVVNASPVVCFRLRAHAEWQMVFVSENVASWGYTVEGLLAGKPSLTDIVHPDDFERVAEEAARLSAEGRSDFEQEYRLLTADRRVLWVMSRTKVIRDAAGDAVYYDGVLTDVTERRQQAQELTETLTAQRQLNKRLEEAHNQLLQSEKMASIGQLAAGIAHELNNPIGFVHSNLGTLEGYLRDVMEIIDAYDQALAGGDEPSAHRLRIAQLKDERDFAYLRQDIIQLLGESKEGLGRVRKIVQDLKSFSHVSEQDWQWADLHQGLDSTLNIVWNELKYKCQVVKDYGDIPPVFCLISQLNQVFMNLLVNAGHAIETKGTVTIRTAPHGEQEVAIEVIDTGKGIPPENLNRIFEPFFTTKPVGKGTGLGLSLAYSIVDKHGGRIDVESQVGVGTTFRVILPIRPAAGKLAGHPTETPS